MNIAGGGRGWTRRWLRTLLVSAAFALSGVPANAQPPSAAPGQRFGFDYRTADLTTYGVTRFEMQLDGQAWTDVGLPPTVPAATTPSDLTTYAVAIPPLTPGAHAVSFRACNATACSAPTTALPFVLVVQPPAPVGTRILEGL